MRKIISIVAVLGILMSAMMPMMAPTTASAASYVSVTPDLPVVNSVTNKITYGATAEWLPYIPDVVHIKIVLECMDASGTSTVKGTFTRIYSPSGSQTEADLDDEYSNWEDAYYRTKTYASVGRWEGDGRDGYWWSRNTGWVCSEWVSAKAPMGTSGTHTGQEGYFPYILSIVGPEEVSAYQMEYGARLDMYSNLDLVALHGQLRYAEFPWSDPVVVDSGATCYFMDPQTNHNYDPPADALVVDCSPGRTHFDFAGMWTDSSPIGHYQVRVK